MQKVKLPYSINSLSQRAALDALGRQEMMERCVRETVRERGKLANGLRALGMKVYPSDANFVLFALPNGVDAKAVQEKLAGKYGILVRDRSGLVPNALRATVCTQKENDYFLKSLLGAAVGAVLFDIDGTLVDVTRSYNEAIRKTAKRISGNPVQMRLVKQVKACSGMNNDWDATVEVLRRQGVRASREEVLPIFQRLYFGKQGKGLIRKEKPLLQLRLLQKIGKPVGIVTGRPRAEARIAMKMLGLPRAMPLVAMEDTRIGKPEPAPLLLAKKMVGAKLPVYLGDSPDDCEAAARAGCAFVAIGNGAAQPGEFGADGCRLTLAQLDDLIAARIDSKSMDSYTVKLARSKKLAVAKIREEGEELAEALEKKGRKEIIWEACDVLYHALVAVRARGITLSDLERELWKRNKKAHKAKVPIS